MALTINLFKAMFINTGSLCVVAGYYLTYSFKDFGNTSPPSLKYFLKYLFLLALLLLQIFLFVNCTKYKYLFINSSCPIELSAAMEIVFYAVPDGSH